MATIIKQREMHKGWLQIIKKDHLYIVRYLNRLGKETSWRYAGKSLQKAEKHFLK